MNRSDYFTGLPAKMPPCIAKGETRHFLLAEERVFNVNFLDNFKFFIIGVSPPPHTQLCIENKSHFYIFSPFSNSREEKCTLYPLNTPLRRLDPDPSKAGSLHQTERVLQHSPLFHGTYIRW